MVFWLLLLIGFDRIYQWLIKEAAFNVKKHLHFLSVQMICNI